MTRFIDEELSFYDKATDEVKRIDHMIYVSLKYTRTADVLKNTLSRMIDCLGFVIEGILTIAEGKNQIIEVPISPGAQVNSLRSIHGENETISEIIEFFLYLRKVYNSEYRAIKEFRRHVAMIATLPNGDEEEINIDIITEYYHKCKRLVIDVREFFPNTED